jgi:hypothetical protein
MQDVAAASQRMETAVLVYLELLSLYHLHGQNFSFPPFESVFNYLKNSPKNDDNKFSLNDRQSRELDILATKGYPFFESVTYLQKLIYEISGRTLNPKGTSPAIRNETVEPIVERQDGSVVFEIPCHEALDLASFIYPRGLPFFFLGVSTDKKNSFDAQKDALPSDYFDHDKRHAEVVLLPSDTKISENLNNYPMLEAFCFSIYMQKHVEALEATDPYLKKVVELILFHLLHEDNNPQNHTHFWKKNDIDMTPIEQAERVLLQRLSGFAGEGKFTYPPEYNQEDVCSKLNEAEKFLIATVNAYRAPTIDSNIYQLISKAEENVDRLNHQLSILKILAQKNDKQNSCTIS